MITDPTTDNWSQVEADSKAILPRVVLVQIERAMKQPHPQSYLISVLHKVQETFGYLGPAQLEAVSQLMRIPSAKVTGVANFYHFFRLRPKGRFVISVCMGTACYVKGATEIMNTIAAELGIGVGQTSADGVFSLEQARCLGTCGLAPVIMIEGAVHGPLKPQDIGPLLEEFRRKAAAEPAKSPGQAAGEEEA